MSDPNFVLLYVQSPLESAAFYRRLLGKPPVDEAPTFVMFVLDSGVRLGLWARSGVMPPATAPGGAELCFTEPDAAALDARFADWQAQGLPVLQAPTEMDFGRTFVVADPDGHRLRVFTPGGQ